MSDEWRDLVDLVDLAGVASRLGVRKDTVSKWRWRWILPEPDYDLEVGPVWDWATIEEWAKRTGRLE